MTRTGKIARLPWDIREQLNQRLQDGAQGKRLVVWLNAQPKVRAVLKREFGGRPLTEQNLSEWKQGGFRDWQKQAERCGWVRRLAEQAHALDEAADGWTISDGLATMLAAELAHVVEEVLAATTDPAEKWQRLQEALRELAELRRDDHRGARLQIDRERWDTEHDALLEVQHQKERQEEKKKLLDLYFAGFKINSLAELFGGGEEGRRVAGWIAETIYDMPPGTFRPKPPASCPVQPNPTESNPIQPDQTEGHHAS